ncbi:unnamed protein product [Euphydryas editha]|uniref:ARID domain-containing protein n=1 Tax=Euphydryas editha TaxID=104508 RepID=A0AAU9UPB2_EUPED|nr:unnamed protein product [Euphydryas editha]
MSKDEVLAINDKVVLRAEDLLSWVCNGSGWRWGLKAVWRGACAPPSAPCLTSPLHHTKLDFSDVEKEKSSLAVEVEDPGVVVFSYPRYCRYRALLARLDGIQADWLRDSLVAALGGYAAPTKNTRILYCKDTFEYPELEGHEFVCNHLAPKLKGRPRGRRRRAARSRDRSPDRSPDRSADSRSSDSDRNTPETKPPRRISLRNGAEKQSEGEEEIQKKPEEIAKDEAFLRQLKEFLKSQNDNLKISHTVKNVSLRSLYAWVVSRGGLAACRDALWRRRYGHRAARLRRLYQRYLLQYEHYQRWNGLIFPKPNGKIGEPTQIDTIDVTDSPIREVEDKPELPEKRLRTPSPKKLKPEKLILDNETGELTKEEMNITSKPAEELNREFLDSLPNPTPPKEEEKGKIFVKPVEKLIEPSLKVTQDTVPEPKPNDSSKVIDLVNKQEGSVFMNDLTQKSNLGNTDTRFLQQLPQTPPIDSLTSLSSLGDKYTNGHTNLTNSTDTNIVCEQRSRPAGRSSLRAVRVKPARAPAATPPIPALRTDTSSSSPPAGAPPPTATITTTSTTTSATTINNFGIHHPPASHSDDEIVEVPYKPKSPEIIDLDEYPESPQGIKKKKLEILKERGLEVTAVPPGPVWAPPIPNPITPLINPNPIILNPALQHQIMTQAQIFQICNVLPPMYPKDIQAPKVIQASSAFGTAGPEKTVYGNPKDPFMPPPHVLQGTPIKPQRSIQTPTSNPQDILDLTCKTQTTPTQKPAVEIVRIPPAPSPSKTPNAPQNLSKNYTLLDGKAVVGSNLEITLVNTKSQTPPKRPPQKRSSNGKFVSAKTPTPPKDYPKPYPSPSPKKPSIVVPNYQIPIREDISPTSSTNVKEAPALYPSAFKGQNLAQMMEMQKTVPSLNPFMDPLYMNAFYSSLGPLDQRQLAMYRDMMTSQFRGYSGLLNIGTPTTKN